jgi:methionyl-tRNA synthetase
MNKFYITIAIPYVNGKPHIGHALEYFQADTVRRFYDLKGFETKILSGADENALKNVQAAEKEGIPTQEFLDHGAQTFKDAFKTLGVHLDVFQRGSDEKKHWPGVQKLWELCEANGDIYKKSYTGLYCVGCEEFKPEKDLVDGLCPAHLKAPEKVEEENYFFKLSNYQDKLIELIESNELLITPANKRQEALSFIKSGLEDFSISRSLERAKGVGVPVPNDPSQVIYVWYDALAIYLTGIGFGQDDNEFKQWWPADLQIIGKDINRFHTIYFPAMLLSAKLPLAKKILIHSFILGEGGVKMSKSLGNVIDPIEAAEELGLENLRYFLLSQIPLDSDGEFSMTRYKEVYNANLANGLGNLIARVAALCQKNQITLEQKKLSFFPEVEALIEAFKFNEASQFIWTKIAEADKKINEEKPWELEGEKAKEVLIDLSERIRQISYNLQPFLPETAAKILKQYSSEVKSGQPLFPRIQN